MTHGGVNMSMEVSGIGKNAVQQNTVDKKPEMTITDVREKIVKEEAAEKQSESPAVSPKSVESAAERANKRMSSTHIEFSYNENVNRVSITVFDDETGEVIREIPPEESLKMLEKMWEITGLLVDEKR